MKNAIFVICVLVVIALGQIKGINAARQPRIINGDDAHLGEIPYQVSLQKDKDHFCGGAIINEYWIVTAAHCLVNRRNSTIEVFAGIINNTNPVDGHKSVEKIIHKDFYMGSIRDDIALIKVDKPFQFLSTVGKVNLPEPDAKYEKNSPVTVSGWGLTHDPAYIMIFGGSYPEILQKATIYIIDLEECEAAVQKVNLHVCSANICAKSLGVHRGHCHADSGGPVTRKGLLIGIVSWSWKRQGCGNPKYPDVYTRVSDYVGWIREHIEENNNETSDSKKP